MNTEQVKEVLGKEAAALVKAGMTVGLGTGSTAYWFIVALGVRVKEGLQCTGVPTSLKTKKLAEELGISLIELNDAEQIHIAVDGADEINSNLQLIKGGGGAILQEKMVADTSDQLVIIAHETKMVETLGSFPLPVEVVPYGWAQVKSKIERLGCKQVNLRIRNEKTFVTDHGHYILDCHFREIGYPATLHSKLNNIPGVVDNGLFINMADAVIIGYEDGTLKTFHPE